MSWANKFSDKKDPLAQKQEANEDQTPKQDDCFIQDVSVVNVGVISTQSIALDEAIDMANKVYPVDSLGNEMIFYKQPAEGEPEIEEE